MLNPGTVLPEKANPGLTPFDGWNEERQQQTPRNDSDDCKIVVAEPDGTQHTPTKQKRKIGECNSEHNTGLQVPIVFREIEPEDCTDLRRLHECCFPVHYNDKFYGEVAKRQYMKIPLITMVARSGHEAQTGLAGGILAQKRTLRDQDLEQPTLSGASRALGYSTGFYVMTLATDEKQRRLGVGSMLLQQVLQQAEADKTCAVVYLHVITYNYGAIKFYEKHNFKRMAQVQGFYNIDGVLHDAYLYCRYIGEAKPEPSLEGSFWNTLYQTVASIFGRLFHSPSP